jgi:hypothetical protein
MTIQRQQRVVRRFLGGSPYRGVLVFHGLGSGKTCAAVAAAEALSARHGMRDVVVMLPASLRANFEAGLAACGGPGLAGARLRYVSTNGVSPAAIDGPAASVAGASLHGCVIVVDEVHNLAAQAANGGARGAALYRAIFNARDAKVILLSGSAVINSPFELGLLLNLAAGPCAALLLHRPRLGSEALEAALRADLRVLAHERDGAAVRVSPAPDGFRRKDARSGLLVRDAVKGASPELGAAPARATDASHWTSEKKPLFPEDKAAFLEEFVLDGRLRDAAAFERRASGLVSFFALTAEQALAHGIPDVASDTLLALDMSDM